MSPSEAPVTIVAMEEYYSDDLVTLYRGDARELVEWVEAEHVVTDPPYGIGKNYGEGGDEWRPDGSFWAEVSGCLPGTGSVHMTVSNKHLPHWLYEMKRAGFNYLHTSVYWNADRVAGNWNGQFAYAWEPILHFSKGPFKLAKRMMTDVFVHDGRKETEHPAERHLTTWEALLDLIPAGTILDPFCGSGTTLVAAQRLGRKAVGIEKEAHWCELAANRLSQLTLEV